jgi:hypothetical protein
MPVYNGAKYVGAALESALAQDYENFEVIVINDGSTDNTSEIISRYSDERIKYIEKENGGVATALNLGIRNMTGDYFCWLSHDDTFLPDKLSRQAKHFLELYKGQNVVLCSDYELIDESGNRITTVRLDHSLLTEKPEYALFRGSIHGCSVFVPRRFFDEVGLFDPSLPGTQDYDLWSKGIDSWTFVHMAEPLIQSRWHPEQGSKKTDYRAEMDALWIRIMDALSGETKVRLEGSVYGFYKGMEQFLAQAKIEGAARHAHVSAERVLDDIKVSVIVPCHKPLEDIRAASASVFAQTHPNIELIVVTNAGVPEPGEASPESIKAILKPSLPGHSAMVVTQPHRAPGSGRNFGMNLASGDYIAFLDADDLFLPHKVRRQLVRMLEARVSVSHSSYFSYSPDGSVEPAIRRSGLMSGVLFPAILSNCPIACPTVMVKDGILGKDLKFPEHLVFGEDVMLWMQLAKNYEILGIEEPLSIVNTSTRSAAYNPVKQQQALDQLARFLQETYPEFPEHIAVIEQARLSIRAEPRA